MCVATSLKPGAQQVGFQQMWYITLAAEAARGPLIRDDTEIYPFQVQLAPTFEDLSGIQ